jgi:hypothetical protein
MVAQKTAALASPGRKAARDLYDLHHLFIHSSADAKRAFGNVDPEMVASALAKMGTFTRADWAGQVLPFLPADLSELYGGADGFAALRRETENAIRAARP